MDHVISIINRSNQRGGRMLSVVDLIEAGTLDPGLAAWLAVRIQDGASFLVGAKPGGAGKTTVMGALLGLLPAESTVHLAAAGSRWRKSDPGDYIVAYELSPGSYEAYVWGEDLRGFARLGRNGRRIVSNLHADTVAEAQEQVVSQNGADEADFRAFELFVPLLVEGGFGRRRRIVGSVYRASGDEWHEAEISSGKREEAAAACFEACRRSGVRTVEEVRKRWLALCGVK